MAAEAIRIRAARLEEYAACRMLLPPQSGMSSGTVYLVAVQQQAPFIVGAAGFACGALAVHGVRVRVVRSHRRRGVGARLLAEVAAISCRKGAQVLLAAADSIREPEAEAFLTASGFSRVGRSTTVRADHDLAARLLYPLADRLLSRLQPHQEIVPLSEAPLTAVAGIYRAELARSPWTTPWAVLDQISAPEYAHSPVLVSGGEVAALLLYRMEGDCGVIPARIVRPGFQGGPANVLLMAAGLRYGGKLGGRSVEFEVPERNLDTEKLARRLRARTIRTDDRFARKLHPA